MEELRQFFVANDWSIVLFLAFLAVQLGFFVSTRFNIRKMSNIFSGHSYSAVNTDDAVTISTSSKNPIFNAICGNINQYIKENSDSIDLGEMKDIANRLADIEYEKAVAKISYPMYIGLMGTYGGVGLGLFKLVLSMNPTEKDSMFDSTAIYFFIGGVVVAMLTSLVGLLLTTINNNISVSTEAKLESEKDRFFGFLQTQILPQLPSTLAQTLRNEFQRSIGALGTTIEELRTTVGSLNTDLKSTFEGITREFGDNLSSNLSSMQSTISTLTESAKSYATTMQKQDEILDKLSSPAFVAALTKISKTVDRCEATAATIREIDETTAEIVVKQNDIIATEDEFAKKQESAMSNVVELHRQLSEITIDSQRQLNELTSQPNEMFNYIRETVERFDVIANFVQSFATQDMSNTQLQIQYINAQIQSMNTARNAINDFVSAAQRDLETYLSQNREQLQQTAQDFVNSWNDMFNHMAVTTGVNPLVHLEHISELVTKLEEIKEIVSSAKIDDSLYEKLENIRRAIETLKQTREYVRTVDHRGQTPIQSDPAEETEKKTTRRWWPFGRRKSGKISNAEE